MEYIQLNNGLKIMIHKMPNTHSVTVGLYIRSGSKYEHLKVKGITHLLEHMHFRALKGLSQKELYYNMESIGSTLKAATYKDFMKYSMKVRPKYLLKSIDIFKKILNTYDWNEDDLNKEKKVVLNQIEEKNSYLDILSIVDKTVFNGSNLSNEIMGTLKSVANITLQQLIEYKHQVFNKNNIILVITGCIDDLSIDMIKEILSNVSLSNGKKYIETNNATNFLNRNPDIFLKNESWNYIDVNLSFDIEYMNENNVELNILNCILGEGVGSRLQAVVREELAYASNIYSKIDFYQESAVLHICFSVKKRLLINCIESIISVLNDIKNNLTQEDLNVAIPFYTENSWFYADDTEELNWLYAYYNFVLERDFDLNQLTSINITVEELMILARKIFSPKNTSIVILGNCNNITKKQIKELLLGLK